MKRLMDLYTCHTNSKKDKIKRAKKMLKAGNAWTTSYAVINAMSQENEQTTQSEK